MSKKVASASQQSTPLTVELNGYELLHEPLLNKGSAFSPEERLKFGLRGLVPHSTVSMDEQARRIYGQIAKLTDDFDKYLELSNLQDRNEHLFYRVLQDHLEEFMPIVYTPTVGLATQRYSRVFRRGRGVWITPDCRGSIVDVLKQVKEAREVSLMVVTDGESILGIGDQGAGGMAISVGKLALYTVGAGIHPANTLPVCLDVGTSNHLLIDDEYYLGWPHPRLRGEEYESLVAEFVEAVQEVFPGALIQWEDFRKENALAIMQKYRDLVPSFNDDIQGTGAVALAGILSGLRLTGQTLSEQRIVIYGAGAAGLGIARQLTSALADAGLEGISLDASIAVIDSRGLIVSRNLAADSYKQELSWSDEVLEHYGLSADDSLGLEEVVSAMKPTVLIGTSGQAGAFSESIVRTMSSHVKRPIVMPFSNPTSHTEAHPKFLYQWSAGRCLVATGSPFEDVTHEGQSFKIGQGNNVFIFPGLGLAGLVGRFSRFSDSMISASAQVLSEQVTEQELQQGLLYPAVTRLREVSAKIAVRVIEVAIAEGACDIDASEDVDGLVRQYIWDPEYRDYV